jgi:hypothetical protein
VFLKNKAILNPEVQSSVGMLYAKDTFMSQKFEFELDLELGPSNEEE